MAQHRHKREIHARFSRLASFRPRAFVVAAPLAVLATAGAVSAGVLTTDVETPDFFAQSVVERDVAATLGAATYGGDRSLSRSSTSRGATAPEAADGDLASLRLQPTYQPPTRLERILDPAATRKAVRGAESELWTTEGLNLWTQPGDDARKTGVLPAGELVTVTGRKHAGRAEIVWKQARSGTRWVTTGYFSQDEPFVLGGECTNGTTVPDAVSDNVKLVHDAVCSAFPEITTYGTLRSDGEHSQGIAIDIMVSGDRGWQVAEFLRENAADLGIYYLIYEQSIWMVPRDAEGWRPMEDRGSVTANHFDHVHVTTY